MSAGTLEVKKLSVIGVGTQGSMISFRSAIHGKQVVGYSRTQASIDTCKKKIDRWLEYYVQNGRLTNEQAGAARGRISYASGLAGACEDADMVIENVPEKLELKQTVFSQLSEHCPEHTLFCSNTSSLLMSEICARLPQNRKEKSFSVDHDDPVRNDYLEMMWNIHTTAQTKQAALRHFRSVGFEPVITEKEIKGYSINRTWRAIKRECLHLWAGGYCNPAEFDRGWMIEWGSKFGPFKLMDLIGLDTIYDIEMSYYNAGGEERDKPPEKLREMIEAGILGMKSGSGFYDGYDSEAGNLEVD